jgi:hypothetical protein
MVLMNVPARLAWALAALVLAACGSSTGSSSATPTASPTVSLKPTPKLRSAPARFAIALAVPGAPNQRDPAFVKDQDYLFAPEQFANADFYPPGYHWRIDKAISQRSIQSVQVVSDPTKARWMIDVTFKADAAAHFRDDALKALHAPPGSPTNKIAVFVARHVVWAPQVVAAPTSDDLMVGAYATQAEAQTIADRFWGE